MMQSVVLTPVNRLGMHVALAHPPGYELLDEIISHAKTSAEQSGGSFTVSHSMNEAFSNADVVYPKVCLLYPFSFFLSHSLPELGATSYHERESQSVPLARRTRPSEGNPRHSLYTRDSNVRSQVQLAFLEEECLKMNANHKDWECTESMLARTRAGKALYMHCLPGTSRQSE
jgi:ornithine carbamoyltransferase